MGPLDVLALAGATLVAVALILEAGYFTARVIHTRNATKRQLELARQVQIALTETSALVLRESAPQVPEVAREEAEYVDVEAVDLEAPVAALPEDAARIRRRQRQAPSEAAGRGPPPYWFPLTEPQRRLLQELALGRRPTSTGDRLRTEVMLEWLATLGFVQRGEGDADYTVTPLGRRFLENTSQE